MSVYLGIKIVHNFGYQKFPAYQHASNSLSRINKFIPPKIEGMVYKITYLVLFIIPKLGLISIPSLIFLYKKKDAGFSQALFGAITWVLFDMLTAFYPYDVLTDLNAAYRRKELPVVVADKTVIDRMTTHLQAGNSVILHGATGSGKSATIRALVKEMEEGRCPALKGKIIYSLDLAQLLSNPNNFLENLVSLLTVVKQAPHAILFIDEIQRLTQSVHGIKVADVLKLYLEKEGAQGKILFVQMLGATTTEEFDKMQKSEIAFIRRFFSVEMGREPNSMLIKQMITQHFANRSNLLLDEAIDQAIEISQTYYPSIALPERAIKILEAVYAMEKESLSTAPITKKSIETALQKGLIERQAEGKTPS